VRLAMTLEGIATDYKGAPPLYQPPKKQITKNYWWKKLHQ